MSGATISLPSSMTGAERPAWEAAVVKALKGGDPARLKSVTRDGLTLEPLVPSPAPAVPLPGWRAEGAWSLATRIDLTDVGAANAQILADLEGGADTLTLVFATSPQARGFGLPLDADVDRLLAGVLLDLVTLRIEAGEATPAVVARIAAATSGQARLVAAFDPWAIALAQGGSAAGLDALVAGATSTAPGQTITLTADGRVVHDAGGTDGQELAYVLAAAVAGWRTLVAAGRAPEDAVRAIGFTLTADVEQFATIAKFRALRLLWALVQEEAGLAPAPAALHGETAWRMMARLDAHTNILRGAIAAFSAGVGGADSLSVLPFTAALGLAEPLARRIARNTQRVLLDESNLWRVVDPGAGSGAIEAETAALAEVAWDLFRTFEAAGGLSAAVRAGSLQAAVARAADERRRDIARRKAPLTGVSEYPDLGEVPASVLAPLPATIPAVVAEAVAPLAAERLGAPFEALRERAAATGPRAFMATLGPIAEFTARATWTRNLLEAGGIKAPVGDGYAATDDLIAAFKAAGTPLAVVVSSDAVYADNAEPAVRALVAAGARHVVVAGKPKDPTFEATLAAAGTTVFLAAGTDVLATLTDLHRRLDLGA